MNDLMMAMMAAKAVGGSGSGGLRGANGLSAYELYVRQGGTLSLTEWLSKPSAGAPAYAESLDWLNANGDQSKIYLLPDGYLYEKHTPQSRTSQTCLTPVRHCSTKNEPEKHWAKHLKQRIFPEHSLLPP